MKKKTTSPFTLLILFPRVAPNPKHKIPKIQ